MAPGTYILVEIFGAAALLLWGIRMARTGVMRAYGPGIRRHLPRSLRNRFAALGTGVVAAGVLQSSTAVAVFLSSLAGLGAVPLTGGLAVMLGADVGSAVIAALLALNLKGLWPVLMLAGYVVHSLFSETKARAKQQGRFLIGLALVMAALTFMGQVSGALAESHVVRFLIGSLAGEPVLAVLTLAVLTWLAHSSMAILLLLASMATSGVVTDSGLIVAAVLGINLGGGIPALALTWRHSPAGRKIIVGNAFFRLAGVLVCLLFTGFVGRIYNALPGAHGFRVVELHIIFNLALALGFLLPLERVAALLDRLIPAPPQPMEAERFGPRYIPPSGPASGQASGGDTRTILPLLALTRETLRMSDVVLSMVAKTSGMLMTQGEGSERIGEVRRLDDRVDTLYEAISRFAIELVRSDNLPKSDKKHVNALLRYSASLENAGDIIDKSLLDIAFHKAKSKSRFSDAGHKELTEMFDYLQATLQMSAEAVMSWRADAAELLLERKSEFKDLVTASSENHIDRLQQGLPLSIETTSFHFGIINDLQRIHTLVTSIANDMRTEFDTPMTKYDSL